MPTYYILNIYLQYLKCLLTSFLIFTYNISKDIYFTELSQEFVIEKYFLSD